MLDDAKYKKETSSRQTGEQAKSQKPQPNTDAKLINEVSFKQITGRRESQGNDYGININVQTSEKSRLSPENNNLSVPKKALKRGTLSI